MKFCYECKHSKDTDAGIECYHPALLATDCEYLATGRAQLAAALRRAGGKCGLDARWFEPKPVRPPLLERLRARLVNLIQ